MMKTNISLKEVVKYFAILICAMVCSIAYATSAGLSRKVVIIMSLPLAVLYYICKRFIDAKWQKYILFSVCYWLVALPFVNRAFVNERIAVAGSDAVVQMYPAMLYIGRTFREAFQALFTGEQFDFPMWEWSLGMGENAIATLNYYGFGDPFYLLAALVSEENLPYFYTLLYYFRMYLGGIVCIAFFYEINATKSVGAYVIGALVYSFSGFSYHSNVFIIFVHAMMYTPMLLWGAERTLKSKKKGLLTSTTFLYALSGFFFLYCSSITLGIYVLYRLITQKTQMQRAVGKVVELLVEYLVGLALSGAIFIPAVAGYFASSRAGDFSLDFGILSLDEIKKMLINLFLPQHSKNQMMAMCAISILSIILILSARRMYLQKVNIILIFLSMIIPAVSMIMSGGKNYDRWQLVIILYFAYLTVVMWDELDELNSQQRVTCLGVGVALVYCGIKEGTLNQTNYLYNLLVYGSFLILIWVMIPICKKWNKEKAGKTLLFILTVFSIYKSWSFVACDWEIFFVRQKDIVHELITEENEEFYRVEYEKTFAEPRHGMNIPLMLDYPGITQYFSIENKYYVDAFGEWETGESTFNNQGMDYRTIIETLAAVKYFIISAENEQLIPYGFEEVRKTEDEEWILYENQYALPILYTYDKVFDPEIYNNEMNGLEKQNVLLQAAVIEEYDGTLSVMQEVQNQLYKGQYTIESIQNGTIENGLFKADAGAVIKLKVLLKANCENYIYLDEKVPIKISVDNKQIKNREKTTLGIVEEDVMKELIIEFPESVTFSLDSMKVYYYDFGNYGEYIGQLNDGSVSNIMVDTNAIECNVDIDKTKILCVAAPYDKGWQAKIDGVETKIYRMNNMFMGIEVPEGEHSISLYYTTPGLKIGLALSFSAVVIIAFYIIMEKRKLRKIRVKPIETEISIERRN